MRAERVNHTISFTKVSTHEIWIKAGTPQKKKSILFSPQKYKLELKPDWTMELVHPQI